MAPLVAPAIDRLLDQYYHPFDDVVDLAECFGLVAQVATRVRRVRIVLRVPGTGVRLQVGLGSSGGPESGRFTEHRAALRYQETSLGALELMAPDPIWSEAREQALQRVAEALAYHLKRHLLRRACRRSYQRDLPLVGTSGTMRRVDRFIESASRSRLSSLILAASTSQALAFATALHLAGRDGEPLVEVDCSSMSPRTARVPDLVRQTGHGTLLLCGLDRMSAAARAELGAALSQDAASALRVVSTAAVDFTRRTSCDGDDHRLVERFSALTLRIPPLRVRSGDIGPLLEYYLRRNGSAALPSPSAELVAACRRYEWPGDVGQLERVCARLARLGVEGEIGLGHLEACAPEVLGGTRQDADVRRLAVTRHPALRRACRFVHQNYQRRLSLAETALNAYVSASHLSHLFQREGGTSFVRFLNHLRVRHAERLLLERPDLAVTEVAAESGFTDLRHFQRVFKAARGATATELRQRAGVSGDGGPEPGGTP